MDSGVARLRLRRCSDNLKAVNLESRRCSDDSRAARPESRMSLVGLRVGSLDEGDAWTTRG